MSTKAQTSSTPELTIGPISSDLVKPDAIFDEVRNLVRGPDGFLRSIPEPHCWLRRVNGNYPVASAGGENVSGPVYGTTRGIFHATVRGDRDILLLHTGAQIWAFQGWTRSWVCIIGPLAANPLLRANLPDVDVNEFPTQWVATSTGVVIIPAASRAYFYDGRICLPLGYDRAPSPPTGLGPESSAKQWRPASYVNLPWTGVNDAGFVLDGVTGHEPSVMHQAWRYGRLGTISTPGNITALAAAGGEELKSQIIGYLEPSCYRGRAQWQNVFGDLSPWSPPSNEVRFARQPAMKLISNGATPPVYTLQWIAPESVQKQIAWDGLPIGPSGTVARNLARTKELLNSGTAKFWVLPLDSMVNVSAFASVPDNVSSIMPDNIPDSWLMTEIAEVDPVPQFSLAAIAFGRMWVANWPGFEGAARASRVGKWGTFGSGDPFIYPDPTGGQVTGVYAVKQGLLLFTETGTFLVENADGGQRTISQSYGCAAPSSIATLKNGVTVWLSRDGFVAWSGTGDVVPLWKQMERHTAEINRGRQRRACAVVDPVSGEYRCWVAARGSAANNRCWTYDGVEWRYRDDVEATGVTVTSDSRRYMIACGKSTGVSGVDGVWVLDQAGDPMPSSFKTGWIRSTRLNERASVRRGYVTMRETGIPVADTGKLQVTARTNFRIEAVSAATVQLYPEVSTAAKSTTELGIWSSDVATSAWSDGELWRRRRVFRAKFDIDLQSCETYQLEFTCTRRIEILSVSIEEQDRPTGGAATAR